MKKQTISSQSFIRTFNANYTNDSFDIYIDDKLFSKDLLYKDFSIYTPISEGKHIVSLTLNGNTNIITSRDIYIKSHQIYTLVIAINNKTLLTNLYLIEDIRKKIPDDSSLVRIGDFCSQKDILNFSFAENNKTFKKIVPMSTSYYIAFPDGKFIISSFYTETKEPFIFETELLFKPYRIYTIYILGDGSSNYPFEYLLSIDGSSFLSFSE